MKRFISAPRGFSWKGILTMLVLCAAVARCNSQATECTNFFGDGECTTTPPSGGTVACATSIQCGPNELCCGVLVGGEDNFCSDAGGVCVLDETPEFDIYTCPFGDLDLACPEFGSLCCAGSGSCQPQSCPAGYVTVPTSFGSTLIFCNDGSTPLQFSCSDAASGEEVFRSCCPEDTPAPSPTATLSDCEEAGGLQACEEGPCAFGEIESTNQFDPICGLFGGGVCCAPEDLCAATTCGEGTVPQTDGACPSNTTPVEQTCDLGGGNEATRTCCEITASPSPTPTPSPSPSPTPSPSPSPSPSPTPSPSPSPSPTPSPVPPTLDCIVLGSSINETWHCVSDGICPNNDATQTIIDISGGEFGDFYTCETSSVDSECCDLGCSDPTWSPWSACEPSQDNNTTFSRTRDQIQRCETVCEFEDTVIVCDQFTIEQLASGSVGSGTWQDLAQLLADLWYIALGGGDPLTPSLLEAYAGFLEAGDACNTQSYEGSEEDDIAAQLAIAELDALVDSIGAAYQDVNCEVVLDTETEICCVPTEWSEWSACDATNTQIRTRTVCPTGEIEEESRFCSAPGEGCVQSWGFFKQEHRRDELGCEPAWLCGLDDQMVLKSPPKKGNTWLVSAHQYLAAYYSTTCGCAAPNATDVALIEAAGQRLIGECSSGDTIPYVGPESVPLWKELIEDAKHLELYNLGNRSVEHCSCDSSNVGGIGASGAQDPEVVYEAHLLDQLVASENYEPAVTDFMYGTDDDTGLPTSNLNGAGIASIAIASIALVAVAVGSIFFGVRHWRRRRRSDGFERLGRNGGKARSNLLHDANEEDSSGVELQDLTFSGIEQSEETA